jgi:hypothetical protein
VTSGTGLAFQPLPQTAGPAVHGTLQRCGPVPCNCPDREDSAALRRTAIEPTPTADDRAPAIVDEVLESPGEPLTPEIRALLEPRFDQDFSQVRVHTDTKAAASAEAVDALAYTVGQHVMFAAGTWAPQTQRGLELVVHELAHTIQQRGEPTSAHAPLTISEPTDASERAADRVAREVVTGPALQAVGGTRHRIARQAEDATAGDGCNEAMPQLPAPPVLGRASASATIHRQKAPAKAKEKPKEKERAIACTPAENELAKQGISDGRSLANKALTALGRITYPGRNEALRKHFGSVTDSQIEAIGERFRRIRDSLGAKTIVCLDHCIKATKHKLECARGKLPETVEGETIPGTRIELCPDFGKPGCEPGPTMVHEAAHNDGATGDVDTDGAYPPKTNPEGNTYSYEHFAVEINKGAPDVKLRPKKEVEIVVPEK